MPTTYIVTISKTEMPKFNPEIRNRSILENFIINDPLEAALACNLLKNAPVGAQLHAYFQGMQLEYKNAETSDITTFKNTYVKFAEGRIAVKPVRHSFIAAGSFGQVKLLIDLKTGSHIVAKEFFTGDKQFQTANRHKNLESYYEKIMRTQNLTQPFTGQISQGIVHKQRNPFKKLCQQKTVEPLNIIYGDTTFSFQMTSEQKAASQSIANKKASAKSANPNAKKNNEDETKPIIYFEYRGYDFIEFVRNKQFLSNDISQLPKLVRESLHILHYKIHSKNLLHCDLKPENLLLLRNKKTGELFTFICDPDFAIEMNRNTKIAIDQLKGTPQYLSPELCLYLTIEQCRPPLFNDEEGLFRRNTIFNFADTIFPNGTNFKDVNNVRYCIETDSYSLGGAWNAFFALIAKKFPEIIEEQTPAVKKKYQNLQKLVSLMAHYHPDARPNLILLQLAILPLEHDALSEETLSSILKPPHLPNEQHLPNISLQNLNRLSECMIQIAEHFDFNDPRPFHFLHWLYQYIQVKLIAPENNERDFTKFIEFICFLHRNNTEKYYMFNKASFKLNEFLTHTNRFYNFVEKYFFDHMTEFTILMQNGLKLRWDHFAHSNDTLNCFTEILQHCAHAHQFNEDEDANKSNKIICKEITRRTHNYIENPNINVNAIFEPFLDIKNLAEIHSLLEDGKSIWKIISDVAQSEKLDDEKMRLLFELTPLLYQKPHFPLFSKNLLGLAVNLNDIDRLGLVSDYVIQYKIEKKSTNLPGLFQINSQQCGFYKFYFYCTLVNYIYLTAKKIARLGDEQLQSDIAMLAAFLERVRNNPLQPFKQISELQIAAISNTIDKGMRFNESNDTQPLAILDHVKITLLHELRRRNQIDSGKAAAASATLS